MAIPVSQAGPKQYAAYGTLPRLTTLTGTATNGPLIEWEWRMLSVPNGSTANVGVNGDFIAGVYTLLDPVLPAVQFTCDVAGSYVLQLKARNGDGWSNPDLDKAGGQTIVVVRTQKLGLPIPSSYEYDYGQPDLNEAILTLEQYAYAADLQKTYDMGTGAVPTILLDATRKGLIIQDKNPTIGAAEVLLGVRGPGGTAKHFNVLGSGYVAFGTDAPNYRYQFNGTVVGGAFVGFVPTTPASGDIIFFANVSAVTGNVSVFNASMNCTGLSDFVVFNQNGTSLTADAAFKILTNGAGGGDPYISMTVSGVTGWCLGVDNSDSDKFKVNPNALGAGTAPLTLTTGGLAGFGIESPLHNLHLVGHALGTPVFTGGGLNDLTLSGLYFGTSTRSFIVEIDGNGPPDTYKWSDDGGSTWEATGVGISTYPQALTYGLVITFGSDAGHTIGNRWTIAANSILGVTDSVDPTQVLLGVADCVVIPRADVRDTIVRGMVFHNPTDATAGVLVQQSPALEFRGSEWVDGELVDKCMGFYGGPLPIGGVLPFPAATLTLYAGFGPRAEGTLGFDVEPTFLFGVGTNGKFTQSFFMGYGDNTQVIAYSPAIGGLAGDGSDLVLSGGMSATGLGGDLVLNGGSGATDLQDGDIYIWNCSEIIFGNSGTPINMQGYLISNLTFASESGTIPSSVLVAERTTEGDGKSLLVAAGRAYTAGATNHTGGSLTLRTGQGTGPTGPYGNLLMVDTGGRVGVNTPSPTSTIDVTARAGEVGLNVTGVANKQSFFVTGSSGAHGFQINTGTGSYGGAYFNIGNTSGAPADGLYIDNASGGAGVRVNHVKVCTTGHGFRSCHGIGCDFPAFQGETSVPTTDDTMTSSPSVVWVAQSRVTVDPDVSHSSNWRARAYPRSTAGLSYWALDEQIDGAAWGQVLYVREDGYLSTTYVEGTGYLATNGNVQVGDSILFSSSADHTIVVQSPAVDVAGKSLYIHAANATGTGNAGWLYLDPGTEVSGTEGQVVIGGNSGTTYVCFNGTARYGGFRSVFNSTVYFAGGFTAGDLAVFNPGTSPVNAVLLDIAAPPAGDGVEVLRDSHTIDLRSRMRTSATPGVQHYSDWTFQARPITGRAGLASLVFSEAVDGGTATDSFRLGDDGSGNTYLDVRSGGGAGVRFFNGAEGTPRGQVSCGGGIFSFNNAYANWTAFAHLGATIFTYDADKVSLVKPLYIKTHSAFTGSEAKYRTGGVQSTSSTPVTVYTHTLTDTYCYTLTVTVTARNTDGTERGSWTLRIPCHREGAGAVISNGGGADLAWADSENPAGWDVDVEVDGNDVNVLFTGEDGKTINVVADAHDQGVSGSA